MAWKSVDPVVAWDTAEYFVELPWPLTRQEVVEAAQQELGWGVEIEDGRPFLFDPVAGLSQPSAQVIEIPESGVTQLSFPVSDVILDETPESIGFFGDLFALLVREGTSRWGKPKLVSTDHGDVAVWRVSGLTVQASVSPIAVRMRVATPEGVAIGIG